MMSLRSIPLIFALLGSAPTCYTEPMSADPESLPFPRKRRRRRWPWILGLVLVLIGGTWFIVERAIQPERYRPAIVERLTKATGLPVELGEIDLTLLPVPSAHVRDIVIGSGDFQAVCEDFVAYPRLESLGRGEIEIGEVVARGLTVTLPRDLAEARTRILALADTISANAGSGPDESGGSLKVSVGTIRAEDARVFFDGDLDHALKANVSVDDVLTDTITIRSDGVIPWLGTNARLDGDTTIERTGNAEFGLAVHGNVSLFDVDTTTFVKTRNIPGGTTTVNAAFERTGKQTYRADIRGVAVPHALDGIDIEPLTGQYSGQAWWDQGAFTVNDIDWQADAIQVRGDVSVPSDGTVAAHITQLHVNDTGLNGMFAFRPDLPVQLSAAPGATFSGEEVWLGVTADRYLRLVQGEANFAGINVAPKTGETAFQGVAGDVSFDEGVIHVNHVEAAGVSLTGDVTPDFSSGVTAIDLSGQVQMTRERLQSLVDLPQIAEATGNVELTRIKATIIPGEGMPADLVVEGSVTNGVLAIHSEAWADRFAPLSATFTAQPGRIDTTAEAASQKLGATTVDGQYAIEGREWRGTVRGDLSKMDLPFLKQESARRVAPGVAAAYGPSAFAIAVTLPGPDRPRATVRFDRDGAPELAGDVEWRKDRDLWALGDVKVDAAIPGAALQAMLPESATANGDVGVVFTRSREQARFDARLDLGATELTFGQFIRKAPGVVASIDIAGEASPAVWQGQTLAIHCLGETVQGRFENGRFVVDPLDLNIATLAPLLSRGGEARGRVEGRVATNPTELDLTLVEFGAALSPDLAIDSVNGRASIRPDSIAIQDLAIVGANSDFRITAEKGSGRWSGNVTGRQLDINGVEALLEALAQYRGTDAREPEAGAEAVPASDPRDNEESFLGTFTANLETLLYRQAHFTNASATVTVQDRYIQVDNLHLARDGGGITGTIAINSGRPVGRFATELAVVNVPAQVIDELAFVEPRGLQGILNGTVMLEMPAGEGINPAHGLSGRIAFTGENGTFGRLGIATQILSVLRATEITRLRIPGLRDEGLTYDTCRANVVMNNGLMTFEEMVIRTPTYLIAVQGTINFPANETELLVHVNLLESVLSAGDLVPGVRELADRLRAAGGMRILVTGPPDNPSTSYGFGPPIVGGITDEIRGTLRTTTGIVRDELLDRATDALRNILR